MRYEVRKSGNGNWYIYDNMRKVHILKPMSPNSTYNESVVRETVDALNAANNDQSRPT